MRLVCQDLAQEGQPGLCQEHIALDLFCVAHLRYQHCVAVKPAYDPAFGDGLMAVHPLVRPKQRRRQSVFIKGELIAYYGGLVARHDDPQFANSDYRARFVTHPEYILVADTNRGAAAMANHSQNPNAELEEQMITPDSLEPAAAIINSGRTSKGQGAERLVTPATFKFGPVTGIMQWGDLYYTLVLKAKKNIASGEQITIDYGPDMHDIGWQDAPPYGLNPI
jgi:hypothetical protein